MSLHSLKKTSKFTSKLPPCFQPFYRLTDHYDPFQSAYHPHHSVETLLVNVSYFIIFEMDQGNINAMLLLDLSSAFDTANHTILLNTLRSLGCQSHNLKYKQANKIHIKMVNIISKLLMSLYKSYFKKHDGTYIKVSLYSCRPQNNWWLSE